MIAAIEEAIIAAVKARIPQLRYADIPRGAASITPSPAYTLATLRGPMERSTQNKYRQQLDITVWLRFANLRSDKDRRHGVYAITEAVSQLLWLETLGLAIAPLGYKGFDDVSLPEEWQAGITVIQLEFSTSYGVMKLSGEEVTDLACVGLEILHEGKTVLSGETEMGGTNDES